MWPIIVLFFLFVGALASLFITMKSSKDPYHDEFHLSLNALPGLKPGQRPATEWLNMGLWKVSQMTSVHSRKDSAQMFGPTHDRTRISFLKHAKVKLALDIPHIRLTLNTVASTRPAAGACIPF